MHVGMSSFFQNFGSGPDDAAIYRHEISMADLAEPLGFDSIWSAEHHFNGYTMCPNVLQFLTYMAGRTERVQLGSMVVVLPWHDPVRVAEEICVLDTLSGGRTILGLGRGLGRIEFNGFRVPMDESRERFVAYSNAIVDALESGVLKSDTETYRQPPVEIRPAPFKSFRGRSYAAAISPETAPIVARLGVGLLVIAQKPWEKTLQDIEGYKKIYRETNGTEAPRPILATWIACHEDEARANEMYEKYIRAYSRSVLEHYEFHDGGLAKIKGYEYYAGLSKNIDKHGEETFVDFLAKLQVWGTPEQVYEQLCENAASIDASGVIGVFSYGGMPFEMAKDNINLFAEKVLPRLKAHKTQARAQSTG